MTATLRMGTKAGRGVIIATVLGSGMAWMDGLIVNVALPAMDKDLGLGVTGLQWTVSGYLLVLTSLLLLGGSLGDVFDRRRVYAVGVVLFAIASVLCGIAQTSEVLIVARLLQGAAGALMVPAGLAIIQASFLPADRGRAIGAWTGFGAVFTAIGPFVGGVFTTYLDWRWAFFVNLPLAAVSVFATFRFVPSLADTCVAKRLDYPGALLATAGLGLLAFGSIERVWLPALAGVAVLALFLLVESRSTAPMFPLDLLGNRQFSAINVCCIFFYGAFAGGVTLLGVRLQTGLGYSPLLAGVAFLPVNVLMLVLSSRFGALASRIGARVPMTVGPSLVAIALLCMAFVEPGRSYWSFVFPMVVLWGLGMSMCIAPLTSAALAAVSDGRSGVASGVNNAATRAGQALAIAIVPTLAGMGGGAALGGPGFDAGYAAALFISAGLCLVSAAIAFAFVDGSARSKQT